LRGGEEVGLKDIFKKSVDKVKDVNAKKYDGYYSQQINIAPDMNTGDFIRSYGQISWLFVAVNRIAQNVGSSEWKAFKGETVQESSLALNVIAHPNRFMSQYQLLWKSAAYLELTGRCFWYIAKDKIGRPKEIWCLNPLDVWVQPDKDNFIKGYLYKVGAVQVPLDVDEVIFINLPDLMNPYSGKGPAQSAANDLEVSKYTNTFVKNFFYNNGTPAGIVNFPDISPDEYDRAVEEYKDKHRGVERSNEILFTKGGAVTFTPITMNIKDMNVSILQDQSRDSVLGAFGVPKSIVGITDDVNRSTAEAAEYTFAMHTIKPLLHLFMDVINNEFVPMFGEDLVLKFTDPVPKNKDFVNTVITTHLDKSMTKNEVRDVLNKLMGWNLKPIQGGDVIYQQVSLQPVGTALPIPQAPVKPEDTPPEEPAKSIKKKEYSSLVRKKINRQILKNNAARNSNFLKMAEPLRNEFNGTMEDYFKTQQKDVVDKVLAGSKDPVDLPEWNKKLQEATVVLYTKCFNTGGQAVVQEFKSISNYIHKDLGISFDIKDPKVQAKIQSKVSKITEVNDTTKQSIKDIIEEAYQDETADNMTFTIANLAKLIASADFADFDEARCNLISQTEVLTSLNQATIEGYKQNADLIDGKAWLASYNNTRETHLEAAEQYSVDSPISVTNQFDVGGNSCDCPGDDSLPADEVCGCECCTCPVVNV
jgi:HK97 family phage portal protein